jgi:hypothetical protein
MKKEMKMKKLLSVVFAAFMMFAAADSALAWDASELTAVLYADETDGEIGIDLGDITTILGSGTTTLAAAGTWSLDMFTNDWAYTDLNIGLFASNGDYSVLTSYIGTTSDTKPEINSGAAYTAIGAFGAATGTFGDASVGFNETYGGINTYGEVMNVNSTTPGYYTGLNASWNGAEGTFTDGVDYVDMYLYAIYADGSVVEGADTDYVSVVRFNTDGSIVLNPGTSATPVPGALVLLGTGLAALAGLRRRS